MATKTPIVSGYAANWPRVVFDQIDSGRMWEETRDTLEKPGVYILYQDGVPY